MDVIESFESVGGTQIYTRTAGEGPDVVVLHGGPGAHHDYLLPQFDLLAEGRRLRYYDQRGGGRSVVPRTQDVVWSDHVSDLDSLLDVWHVETATVVGYSWGGLLALLYAVEHAQRVERLALISPVPITAAARRTFERRLSERMRDPRIASAREELRRSGLRGQDPNAYRRRLFELSVAGYFHDPDAARGLTPFRVTGRVQDSVWRSLGEYDLRQQLTELSVPAVVLHGRSDPIPLHTAQEIARLLTAPIEIFEHSGHVPYVEETQRFVETLDRFLPRSL